MGDSSKGPAPLAGIRVLDLSRVLAGPLATMTLGDLGADVIKVERPGEGDDTRHWGPPFSGDDAAYFLSLNRNKRSVALDLKTPEGVAEVRRLAGEVDVLIENFRPGLMAELGLALEDLRTGTPAAGHLLAHRLRRRRGRHGDPPGLRHHRPGAERPDERHRRTRRRTHESRRRAARRHHRTPGHDRDPGRAARTRAHGARAARQRVALRCQRRRHGESGLELPGGRPGAEGHGLPAPQHRAVSGVPWIGPAVHRGRRQRSVVPADLRGVGSPGVGRGRAVHHERGACESPGHADPHDGRGRSPHGPPGNGSLPSRTPPSRAHRSEPWTRSSPVPRAPR